MIHGEKINRESLVEHLTKGFCKVQFRKQTNGRFRSLVCTLDTKQIPAKYYDGVAKSIGGEGDPNLLPVFDVVSRDWKSFYIPNVLYFHTEDELRGNKQKPSEEKGVDNAKRSPDRRKAQAPQAKRPNKKK
jgi:hypothetical protein